METIYNYEPRYDKRASFYGKAQEIDRANGDKILLSYGTPILKITSDDKMYYTSDYKYSQTTLRHAKDFVLNYKANYLNADRYTNAQFIEINGQLVESLDF